MVRFKMTARASSPMEVISPDASAGPANTTVPTRGSFSPASCAAARLPLALKGKPRSRPSSHMTTVVSGPATTSM